MDGRIAVGHPVDVASGAQFTAAHDVVLPGAAPLVWRRFYSTALLQRSGILGAGWVHFFDKTLTRGTDGFVFFGHDGAEAAFADPTGVLDGGARLINRHAAMELRREADCYVVYHWHDWDTEVQRMVFLADDSRVMRLHRIENPARQGCVIHYDGGGRIAEVAQTVDGRSLRLEYDRDGRLFRLLRASPMVARSETVATYDYDADGRLSGCRDAGGYRTRYRYDRAGRLVEEIGPTGARYVMRYDDRGRCIETTGRDGYGRRRLVYDDAGAVTLVADSVGAITAYRLNPLGQVTATVLPNGAEHRSEFDAFGRVTARSQPGGLTTRYEYDAAGNLSHEIRPGGATMRISYNDAHQPTEVRQPDGGSWRFDYRNGSIVGIADPTGAVTLIRRDATARVVSVSTPTGNVIDFAYAPDGSGETITDRLGRLVARQFDPWFAMLAETDAAGLTVRYDYEPNGLLRRVTDAAGRAWSWSFDAASNTYDLTLPGGEVASWTFSDHGDVTAMRDVQGNVHRYDWDSEGRLVAITNPRNETAHLVYDSVGNVTEQVGFSGRRVRFAHDQAGRVVDRQDAEGRIIHYGYDAVGNLVRVGEADRTLVANEYDIMGRLTRTTTPDRDVAVGYDLCGRITVEHQGEFRVETRYSPDGTVIWRRSAAAAALETPRDLRGRITALIRDSQPLEAYEYDEAGRLARRHMGAAVESFAYDGMGRCVAQHVHRGSDVVLARFYQYDARGHLVQVRDGSGREQSYAYDLLGQLVHSTEGAEQHQYTYDSSGNLTQQDGTPFRYDAGSRLASAGASRYARDADGYVTAIEAPEGRTTLQWDALGRLRALTDPAGATVHYGYDGVGRRVSRTIDGRRSEFYWHGDALAGESLAGQRTDYTLLGLEPTLVTQAEQTQHVIVAANFTPLQVIDGAGQVTWQGSAKDWGAIDVAAPATLVLPFRLLGQQYDAESGLHYNRYRYFAPSIGQFLSPDPLGFVHRANEYAFAPNPIEWADPLGLICGVTGCKDHAVYVLESETVQGSGNYNINYVGITMQDPQKRCDQHKSNGKVFDQMRVVQTYTGPNANTNRRDARNLEGSSLENIYQGDHNVGGLYPVNAPPTGGLQNAVKKNGHYYHSYSNTHANYMASAQTQPDLNGNQGTYN